MVMKKKVVRKTYRKTYKKKAGLRAFSYESSRVQRPIAPSLTTQLRYTESYVASAGTPDYQYRLNSIFDPNFTGVGHQPYGRDTLVQLYARYVVTGVSYKISASTNATNYLSLTVVPTNDAGAYTSISLAAETPRAKCVTLTNNKPASISGKIDLAALNGVTRATYVADDRFQAPYSTNPTENLQLHILVGDMVYNTAAPADSTYVRVELIYHVKFFDPLELAQS